MASTSVVILGPPSTLRRPPRSLFLRPDAASLRVAPFRRRLLPPHCIADLSRSSSGPIEKNPGGIEQDPIRLWNRYVDWLYHHKDLNLSLDVSRIGFTDEFVKRMEPRLEKVIQVMQKLEKGPISNPDERRMVGNYWLRSPRLAPTKYLKSQIENTLKDIHEFADHIVKGEIKPPSSTAARFTQILCIGIGGSALGPQFVAEALAPETPSLKIRFIDSTDPAGIDHQIAQIGGELASTLVIAISKTGAYPETRKGLLEVQGAFQKAGLHFPKQGWLKRFPMFDWVGGRHSVMSAAGLLPAALQGIKIDEILKGAALMDEETRTTEDMIVLPYEDNFLLLRRYLQQLVMESLGKEFDLNGNR
ncbi:Glucose-6-phosphate isomerase 1, chloroplastic, partial [Ananas comosus]